MTTASTEISKAKARLVEAYKELSDLTAPQCAHTCRLPRTCCSGEYCLMAIEIARDLWDMTLTPTDHPTLPLMGPEGCIAPPHVRPLCTRHLCSINAWGFDPDQKVTDAYYAIVDAINEDEGVLILSEKRE